MTEKKTLAEREKELQCLLSTPTGREQLAALESRYQSSSGSLRPEATSIITYILVCERDLGLIRL
jgi:hypothetical protein